MTIRICVEYACDGTNCVAGNPTRAVDITPHDPSAPLTVMQALNAMALRVPSGGWENDHEAGKLLCPWCAKTRGDRRGDA